ncbi:MAG: hypothetical protein HY255_04280 [Betaproteobacteria bacterium]|nr:hypothetical protein [Betaproteobacteria bacterium]
MKVNDVRFIAGGQWLMDAAKLFRAQPMQWARLLSSWVLVTLGTFFLFPPFSSIVALILQPALFAGFSLAARDQEAGLPVTAMHLFSAFKLSGRALVTVGIVTMFGEIISFALMVALGFPSSVPLDAEGAPDFKIFSEQLQGKESLVLAGFALSALIKSLLWFAPPLLALKPMPAWHAIRWSFYAWVANFLPIALFAVLVSLLFLLATLPGNLGVIPGVLGLMLFLPVYTLSQYTSFRAVFSEL